jgi:hypothetical protein
MRTLSIKATTVLSLLTALRLVHAQSGFFTESASTPTPTSCPAAVSVQNGGFDSGLAPWATLSAAVVNPTFSVVSPGYNGGAHALQLEFPAANVTSWYFLQDIGLQCEGEQYFTSFAVNWLNFSIHGNLNTNFCHLFVDSSYCYDTQPSSLGIYNATNTSGWQYHSFTCTAQKTGYATFVVNVGCEADYVIPAFTWQMTDFDIQLVVSSTPPQPTPSQSIPSQVTPAPSQSSNASPSFLSSLTSGAPSTSSITLSATTPSSTNVLVGTTSATTISTSSASVSMNTTSIPTRIPANNACQALKTSFLTGPMGLILLLPYLLYQL